MSDDTVVVVADGITPEPNVVCGMCGMIRTPDIPDYSPIQPMTGQPLGWYSGNKDGEICPREIAELMGSANRMPYRYYGDGK